MGKTGFLGKVAKNLMENGKTRNFWKGGETFVRKWEKQEVLKGG